MDNILAIIRTTKEAQEILSALDGFAATLYVTKEQEGAKQENFSNLQPQIRDMLNDVLCKELITQENREHIRLQIQTAQKAIRTSKKVQLTLTFQPDDTTISEFSSWIKTHAGKEFLIDIQIDKTIIAGAIITTNGLHKDYSLHKKLSDVFQIQREQLMDTLN